MNSTKNGRALRQKPFASFLPVIESVNVARKTRIVLADDHAILREAVATLLRAQPDMEVVGEASDGESAVALAQLFRPDLVVMDISMPRMNGIQATREIASRFAEVKVVGFSMHEDEEVALSMCRAGACAILKKGDPGEVLLQLLRQHGVDERD